MLRQSSKMRISLYTLVLTSFRIALNKTNYNKDLADGGVCPVQKWGGTMRRRRKVGEPDSEVEFLCIRKMYRNRSERDRKRKKSTHELAVD